MKRLQQGRALKQPFRGDISSISYCISKSNKLGKEKGGQSVSRNRLSLTAFEFKNLISTRVSSLSRPFQYSSLLPSKDYNSY